MGRYLLWFYFVTAVLCKKNAKLVNNGYEGMVIAIHPEVPEDSALIDAIKTMMTDASKVMFQATRNRAYFKDITILVPKTWTSGSYSLAADEDFSSADIRVQPRSDDEGHTPRAWTSRRCGNQGEYVDLTPDYITKDHIGRRYGIRGKVVVHEWAHYRWGVYDEYPTEETNSFYLNPSGQAEATRCSLTIRGTTKGCQYDKKTRLPVLGCEYLLYQKQDPGLQTSLMYAAINEINMFCHDDPSDKLNMHNKDAPNNQNKYCNKMSTWDVISNTADFKSANPPNPSLGNNLPKFTVVKHQNKRTVIVLDVSGSMAGEKLATQRSACEEFFRTAGDGSFVGIVEFESSARILDYLTELKHDDGSREKLARSLPTSAFGGTGIGGGILKGIEVLEASGQSAEGGQLVVLTDGEENQAPFVVDVRADVLRKGVVVHSAFLGLVDVAAGEPLASLSEQSGGAWYFASDEAKSKSELNNIFSTLAQPNDGDYSTASVQITSNVLEIQEGDTLNSTVAIDSSVGNRTTFIFNWLNIIEPEIELSPPDSSCLYSNVLKQNKTYCENIHTTDISTRTIKFDIPGTAQVGIWNYTIASTIAEDLTVTVTSASSTAGVYPIIVEPELRLTNVSGHQAAVVIAKVFQRQIPVLGATVSATIGRPEDEDVNLELKDNGAGADVRIDDGVYSRYFTNFSAQGRYSVQVTVLKNGSDPAGIANIPQARGYPGEVSEDGTFIPNPDYVAPSPISGVSITGFLERVASSPGIAYTGLVTSDDIYPPNKITDLSVTQVDLDNATAGVLIKFTAPGDDYDTGTASRYEVRYTNESSTILLSDFDSQFPVNTTNEYDLKHPKPALMPEEITVFLSRQLFEGKSVRVEFAIRAFDEVDNPSEVSNLAFTTFFFEPPPPPPSTPTGGVDIRIIVGAAVGGGVVLIVLVIAIVILLQRRNK